MKDRTSRSMGASGRIHDCFCVSGIGDRHQQFIFCILQCALLLDLNLLTYRKILQDLLASHAAQRDQKGDPPSRDIDPHPGVQGLLQFLPGIPGDHCEVNRFLCILHAQVIQERASRSSSSQGSERHLDMIFPEEMKEPFPHSPVGDQSQHIDMVHTLPPTIL